MTKGRLFVALDLPADAITALEQIQPRAAAGLKRIDLDQLHLTLHFLGESDSTLTPGGPVYRREQTVALLNPAP